MPPNPDKTILIYLYDKLSKNPSFLKNSNKKNPIAWLLKGWKCLGSPDRTIIELFAWVIKLKKFIKS